MQADGTNTNIIHYYAYKLKGTEGIRSISLTSQFGDYEHLSAVKKLSPYSNAQPSYWAELHVCFIEILPLQ